MTGQMRTDMKESLSALLDGETSDWETRRVLDEIERDPQLREAWHQYHRAAAGLGGLAVSGSDISARIAAAISDEVPHRAAHQWLKPISQVAVAASVAAVSLFTVQQFSQQTSSPATGQFADLALDSVRYEQVVVPEGFELPPLFSQPVSSGSVRPLETITLQLDSQLFDKDSLDKHLHDSVQRHLRQSAELDGSLLPYVRDLGDGLPSEQ
jgi:sigma-E factor negative regulatory protein RseA